MKIGIDISQIVYPGTGIGQYVRNLVESLIDNYQDEFILFGSSLRKYSELEKFVGSVQKTNVKSKLIHVPPKLLSILWNDLHQIPIENFVGKIDIFHTSDWTAPSTHAINITTIYDMIVYKYPETSDPQIISTQKKRLHWVQKETDMVIAISQSTKQDIMEILHIPQNKIRVIYPGINKNFSKKNVTEIERIKRKYRINGDYILSVGTLEPRKNITRVIEAFKYLQSTVWKNSANPIQLILVGKLGWGNAPLPSSEYIKLLGYVDDIDMAPLYSGATIFVYPSLYEGFGYPVAEAMACGTAVITSNRGSLIETAGDAGVYVNPEDTKDIAQKIMKLSQDEPKRKKLIEKGLSQVRQFNIKNMTNQTYNLYKELYEKKIKS